MRRFIESLLAVLIVAVPVLTIAASTATAPTVAAATGHTHVVASACAPEDPGTL